MTGNEKPAVGFGLEGTVWDPNVPEHKEKERKQSIWSIVWDLRKQFKVGAQIKHMTLPPSFCQPRSLLERYVDMYAFPCFLFNINQLESPEERFLRILQFYVSSWHIGFTGPKKLSNPFNPIIGETLACRWNHSDGSTTTYISEQISHHPPISAAVVFNQKHQFLAEATVRPGYFSFLGNSVETGLSGKVRVKLLGRNETYELTFPNVAVRGLVIGTIFMGYHGRVTIKCEETQYQATMLFDTDKKSSSLTGEAIQGETGRPFLKIDGQWKGDVNATDLRTGTSFNLFSQKRYPFAGTPEILDLSDPLNSINVWKEIITSMKNGDEKSALEAKLALEQRQREEAAERERQGITWRPRLFHMSNSDPNEPFFTLNNLDDWMSERKKLSKNDTLSTHLSYSPAIRR